MADALRAMQGDTLDLLIWRELSLGPDSLAAVLEANPGLADLGAVLPIGTLVTVPATVTAAAATPETSLVQLWD